eukprot:scaffold3759_cov61-Cyclotella_meneghiniana.AAC.2
MGVKGVEDAAVVYNIKYQCRCGGGDCGRTQGGASLVLDSNIIIDGRVPHALFDEVLAGGEKGNGSL